MLCWLTLHYGTVFCTRCSAYTSHFDILCHRLNISCIQNIHMCLLCTVHISTTEILFQTYPESVPKNSNSSKHYASLKLKCCIIIQRGHVDVQSELIKTALLGRFIYKWLFNCEFDRPSFKFICRYAVCLSTRLSIKRILLSPSTLI